MIYGYLRCSTDAERQNIDRQERDIKSLVNENIDFVYSEFESGTKEDRKELMKLLSAVNAGDTVVCSEVSRISRSTKQLCEIVELAKDKKLKLIFGAFVIDCTKALDPMTEGMLKMMGVFSEMERNITVQRINSGLANARAKGKVLGRPKVSKEDIPEAFMMYYKGFKKGKYSKSEFARISGLSRPTIDKYLKLLSK